LEEKRWTSHADNMQSSYTCMQHKQELVTAEEEMYSNP